MVINICFIFMLQLHCWPFPEPKQYALDVDASSYRSLGVAGCGGLIRDDKGNWISGFSGPVDFADSLYVELQAILQGLLVTWEIEEIKNLSVRSDCKKALQLITESTPQPHQYSQVIDQIKELKSRDWFISFFHIHQESNQCADYMARLGAHAMNCMGIFFVPPTGLSSLLMSDAKKIAYPPGRSFLAML
jgi:ribonuclease HI